VCEEHRVADEGDHRKKDGDSQLGRRYPIAAMLSAPRACLGLWFHGVRFAALPAPRGPGISQLASGISRGSGMAGECSGPENVCQPEEGAPIALFERESLLSKDGTGGPKRRGVACCRTCNSAVSTMNSARWGPGSPRVRLQIGAL
jgi:hypothetical protein